MSGWLWWTGGEYEYGRGTTYEGREETENREALRKRNVLD